MGYAPHLSVEAEIDLPQLHAQLERLFGELRHTKAKEMQISEAGRRNLILIAQKMEKCAEEIWSIVSSQGGKLTTGADLAMSGSRRSW